MVLQVISGGVVRNIPKVRNTSAELFVLKKRFPNEPERELLQELLRCYRGGRHGEVSILMRGLIGLTRAVCV